MEGDAGGKVGRRLTRIDALFYVREVKHEIRDQPEKYDVFLQIMKDYNSQRIDKARVVATAKELFEGRNRLIHGLNTFLPDGCEIALDEPLSLTKKPITFEEAVSFMHKVKVARLFAGHSDLFEGFKRFLPENCGHDEELSCTNTVTSRRLQMVRSILKPRMKLHKDCVDLDDNEDMMKKVHVDDRNASGSYMSC
ncbi:hypothetical protein NL676_006114 [Syzygium grande]|nr:hypothetical protein NL676_006114 [Syzygium grande]